MRHFTALSLALIFAGISGCSNHDAEGTDGSTEAGEHAGGEEHSGNDEHDGGEEHAGGEEHGGSGEHGAGSGAESTGWSVGDIIPSGSPGVPDIRVLEVHKNGSGEVCGMGKTATLKYKAMLADGTVIDPGTRPFSFQVGSGRAIKGWDVIVSKMRVGDSFTVTCPQQLAYGPSRGDLKFDMELQSVR